MEAAIAAGSVKTLASSTSVGDTTFTLSSTPPSSWVAGATVLISAYTTRAELKSISSVAGTTLTVSALRTAHTAGDLVLVLQYPYVVSPVHYGCPGGSSDNWAPLQRAAIETTETSMKFGYVAALAGATWRVSQPVCVATGSQWENIGLNTHSSFAPIEAAGAVCMVSNRAWKVTATASDDTFTVAGSGHGMSSYSATNTTKIVFNNPYGETLPGGITSGKVYYIKTVPNATTFTVSATAGGATLDITSDGTARAFESIDQLSRVYWDNIRIDINKADCNGLRVNMQQPAYIRNLRIEQDTACTTATYGAIIGGQIGYLDNIEINPTTNSTGLYLYGSGMVVRGFNCNGVNNGDTGILIQAGDNLSLSEVWTEQCGVAGIQLDGGRGVEITGSWLTAISNTTSPALKVTSTEVSYSVGQIRCPGGAYKLIEDTAKGYTMYATAGADLHSVVTDYQSVFPGWTSPGANYGALEPLTPTFRTRFSVAKAADYDVRYIDGLVSVDSTGAARSMTLPSAAGWIGHEIKIGHWAGSNTVTVDTENSQTIDNVSSVTVDLYETLSFTSDGSNWKTGVPPPSANTSSTQSGTTYTLALTDANTIVDFSSGSAIAVTIPTNASVAFPLDTIIELTQYGAGQITVSGDTGVTLRSPGSKNKTAAQYATMALRKKGTDEWMIEGDISA